MIDIEYRGWFQCRLATDPDPFDEPRGVSGYVRAYADEPDLDRIIRFRDPPFERSHARHVGVVVHEVRIDGRLISDHPLLGAVVNLEGEPKFEGRNGVVADDQFEPIWPYELTISGPEFKLRRSIVASDPAYPYPEFFAGPGGISPPTIAEVTGTTNLPAELGDRAQLLSSELAQAPAEPRATAIMERLAFIRAGAAQRMFNASMKFEYSLRSDAVVDDPHQHLGDDIDIVSPWKNSFWMGAWDADALCGFVLGTVTLPSGEEELTSFSDRSVRRANVGSRGG